MNPLERTELPEHGANRATDRERADTWTALPVIIGKHETDTNSVSVRFAVKARVFNSQTGKSEDVEIKAPDPGRMPLLYPGGGGFRFTFPVKDGDEGLAIFSSRCIDEWWEKGGVQKQAVLRMHDLSDGFVITGFSSKKKALKDVSKDTVQLRSEDGKYYFEMAANGVFNLKANAVNLISADSPTVLTVDGDVVWDKAGTATHAKTHKHDKVQMGNDQTDKPVAGS
jgi:hypothetical protein